MTKKLSILSVNISDYSGGAARAAYRIHKALNESGALSRMFVKYKSLKEDKVISISDYVPTNFLYRLYFWVINKIKNKIQHYKWHKYPKNEEEFLSDLRSTSIHGAFSKLEFDVLHLHWVSLRFLDLKELKKVNKPIVWTLHDCWPFTGICHYCNNCKGYMNTCGNCPALHSEKWNDLSHDIWQQKAQLYKGLDLHIVTPSKWLGQLARNSSLFSNLTVTVIPNPVDTELYQPGDRQEAYDRLGLQTEKNYLLYSAMNAVKDKRKGFAELIQALNHYTEEYSSQNLVLLVVGANQPISELNTTIPVHYLGTITDDKDMVAAYRVASLLITPSLSENLSNAIMEGLSCGTPVVAFDIGGNGDMIDHMKNGYLAKALDTRDLAKGIHWILENNNNKVLSVNARNKVLNNYSLDLVAEKYLKLFSSIKE